MASDKITHHKIFRSAISIGCIGIIAAISQQENDRSTLNDLLILCLWITSSISMYPVAPKLVIIVNVTLF